MLIDANTVVEGQTIRADLCIVGTGPAGSTLARRFIDRRLNVCVLESGSFEHDAATQALYEGRVVDRPYFPLHACRTRQFGGSSNCWAGFCRPLDGQDFLKRPWVPHSGWPFELETLAPYYDRAADLLHLQSKKFSGADWLGADQLAPDSKRIQTQVWNYCSPPNRLGPEWKLEFAGVDNLHVYTNANVTQIELEANGQAVSHLAVSTLAGRRFSVEAKYYVLACGGIENPRLLLASRNVDPSGVGNANDLVGRFFMDHPHCARWGHYVSAVPMKPKAFAGYRPLAYKHKDGLGIWAFLRPRDEILRKEEILNAAVVFRHARPPKLAEDVAMAIGEYDAPGQPAKPQYLGLGLPIEHAPNPDSRVTLGTERDALGMPRSELDWKIGELELRTVRATLRILAEEFGAHGVGRVRLNIPSDPQHVFPYSTEGGRHHIGTTRMHDDPKQGVVDANCHVHGIANLMIGGSSVFPTSGAANPTFTIVAMALRMADHIEGLLR